MIIQTIKFLLLNIFLIEFFIFFKLLKKIDVIFQNLKNIKKFIFEKKFLQTENEEEYFSYLKLIIKDCFYLLLLFLVVFLFIFFIKFLDNLFYENLFTYKFLLISIIFCIIYIFIRVKLS